MNPLARPVAVATFVASTFAVAAYAQEAKPVANTAGTFKVDPVHSMAMFRISHLSLGAVYGLVPAPTGTVEQDANGLTKVEVTLEVDKINTGNEKRDQHLKNADFFNAKQFPQMTFKSTSVKPGGAANSYDVTGDLTIKGKTKSVTVTIKKLGEGQGMQRELRAGFETKFVVNRLEHGIDWNPGAVGNDVDVSIAFEAIKQ